MDRQAQNMFHHWTEVVSSNRLLDKKCRKNPHSENFCIYNNHILTEYSGFFVTINGSQVWQICFLETYGYNQENKHLSKKLKFAKVDQKQDLDDILEMSNISYFEK